MRKNLQNLRLAVAIAAAATTTSAIAAPAPQDNTSATLQQDKNQTENNVITESVTRDAEGNIVSKTVYEYDSETNHYHGDLRCADCPPVCLRQRFR
jgi:lipopolysaccharide export LptBFGC system permease protein LptF